MCSRCKSASSARNRIAALSATLYLGQALVGGIVSVPAAPEKVSVKWSVAIMSALTSQAQADEAEGEKKDEGTTKWTCPMHPHYIADEFGACPICGMDLVKLEIGGGAMGATSAGERTVVSISPEMIQNMGVRLGKAEASVFGRQIRSYGIVQENERLVTEITARVEGWVEQLKVTAVGDEVQKGMPLFKLYSPRLITSQNDHILSRNSKNLAGGGLMQLRAFGVQKRALNQIKNIKKPLDLVPFYAERGGTVSELNLREGGYVKRGMLLARIQDYSSVWLIVGVVEKDLSFVGKETPALVTFPNLPGREVRAMVDYIYPTIDPKTRTGQVRLVIENPDGHIRPGSYADVDFEVGTDQRIAVPTESILKNGEGRHVVISLGQGRFQPRLIRTGLTAGGWTEVISGVKPGEDVVVSGQFLLDSESALRESFHKLQRLQLPLSLLKLDRNSFAMIEHLIDAALYIHEALVDGYDVDPAQLDAAISIKELMWPQYKDTQLSFVLDDATNVLKKTQEARTETELQTALQALTKALEPWIFQGAPTHYRDKQLAVFKDTLDRKWLQIDGTPYNPYGREQAGRIPYPETDTPSSEEVIGQILSESSSSETGTDGNDR